LPFRDFQNWAKKVLAVFTGAFCISFTIKYLKYFSVKKALVRSVNLFKDTNSRSSLNGNPLSVPHESNFLLLQTETRKADTIT
jgi:hypothetical protein